MARLPPPPRTTGASYSGTPRVRITSGPPPGWSEPEVRVYRIRHPRTLSVLALLALVASGGVALGHVGDRSAVAQAADVERTTSAAPDPAGSPLPSRTGAFDAETERLRPRPTACTYPGRSSHRPAPTPARAPSRPGGASAVLTVTGVLSAEGWVPPAGQTCPPEP